MNIFSHPIRLGFLLFLFCIGIAGISRLFLLNEEIPASQYRPVTVSSEALNQRWVVNADQAIDLIQQGAILLDARSLKLLKGATLPGSNAIAWQDFSQSEKPNKGKLLTSDRILTKKLQALGIVQNKPVVVVINPKTGWGEDGRIVWMLRSLGHRQAVFVDGGYPALVSAGWLKLKQSNVLQNNIKTGDFVVRRRLDWTVNRDQLQQQFNSENIVVIDSREPREYNGQTPYGEKRGGHIPGAIHLYYQDWLDEDGLLLSQSRILAQLNQLGITPETEIIIYCTGGIRSAWLTAVFVDLGYNAKNYPGSMWEWSASAAADYPLE
ncbi:MAG: rhodanese-like domain-containing protein [Microcoleaceae cyanobacterium]